MHILPKFLFYSPHFYFFTNNKNNFLFLKFRTNPMSKNFLDHDNSIENNAKHFIKLNHQST